MSSYRVVFILNSNLSAQDLTKLQETAHQMLVDTIIGSGEDPNTFTFNDTEDLGQKEVNHCHSYNGYAICAWK